MTTLTLEHFLQDCDEIVAGCSSPAEIVQSLAPRMQELVEVADSFLSEEMRAPWPASYARHPVHICPKGGISLFSMVWQPGQWTPIHDHGTWGVVGVVQGIFEERGFIRCDAHPDACEGVELMRGGVFILPRGGISTFVPNPDHIHIAGNDEKRDETVITLHLYGREMSDYHEYCLESKTKTLHSYQTMSDGS